MSTLVQPARGAPGAGRSIGRAGRPAGATSPGGPESLEVIRLLLLSFLAAPLCAAITLHEVVAPQARLTPRVLFVVDVSGSMKGPEFTRALTAVRSIAAQPVDQLEFAVLAFNDGVYRWEGHPDADAPPKWACAPSEDAVRAAEDWLSEQGAEGDTLVIPALAAALAEERDTLSVVLVTDGGFYRETQTAVLEALTSGQKARVDRGLDEAVVVVYGVGSRTRPVLEELGKVGKGGYWQEEEELELEDE